MSGFFQELEIALPNLSKSDAKIGRFILQNRDRLSVETGASIAKKTAVSEITVSRFLRKFGVHGLNGLRELALREMQNDLVDFALDGNRLDATDFADIIRNEVAALAMISDQISTPQWQEAIRRIDDVDQVYVTGFQMVRGMAQDFASLLSIIRSSVRFVSAYDSTFVEWLPSKRERDATRLLILVDVIPYARDAEEIAKLCAELGIELIVVTDEVNHWASQYTDYVFYIRANVGTVLESTGPMTSFLNLIVHAVATNNPERSRLRMEELPKISRRFSVY